MYFFSIEFLNHDLDIEMISIEANKQEIAEEHYTNSLIVKSLFISLPCVCTASTFSTSVPTHSGYLIAFVSLLLQKTHLTFWKLFVVYQRTNAIKNQMALEFSRRRVLIHTHIN